jgi:hypothetical protein
VPFPKNWPWRTPAVKIFAIGYWGADYMILTLVDGRNQYLTVTVRRDDRLKTGSSYFP